MTKVTTSFHYAWTFVVNTGEQSNAVYTVNVSLNYSFVAFFSKNKSCLTATADLPVK